MTKAPFLHVANGTSTTTSIRDARIPGLRSIWADPLYDGPVPGALSDDELVVLRARHLAGPGSADVDPSNDLRQWRAAIERRDAYEELILWYEHDLFDQLNLIQLLTWIRERLPARKRVSLICINAFPGHPGFRGLGELSPGEIASLLDTRQPVNDEQYSVAERAWRAFREPSPEPLDDFRRGDTGAMPYLAAAFTRFLQEYPWTTDGLSRSERRLMTLAAEGRVDLATVFPRMQEKDDVYCMTGESLVETADDLSRASPPLLALLEGPGGGALDGSVAVTATGRDVLAGREDRVALCGIQRWLGGVLLQGHANVWRWDEARQRITRQ